MAPFGASRAGLMSVRRDAIPDSEADQKLAHRWYLGDNGPFVDQVATNDATNNGTVSVSGDWVDGSAREADGDSEWVNLTDWDGWWGDSTSDWAIALSLKTNQDQSSTWLGSRDSENRNILNIRSESGVVEVLIRDETGNIFERSFDVNYADDSPRRFVINKTSNSGNGIRLWENGSEISGTTDRDQGFTDPANTFPEAVGLFCENEGGVGANDFFAGVIDDVCVFEDSLSESEIESYLRPWE